MKLKSAGFSFSHEIQQAPSSLRRSTRFIDPSRPCLPDRAGTLYWLKRIGYYRLSAYFIPFKDAATGNFRPGTTFEQIIDLYRFDVDLRRLVREALDRIEISVRAVITYEIGKDLGVFGYADRANFAAAFNHADFMKILRREEGRSTEVFIGHTGPNTHPKRNCPYGWQRS